MQPSIVQAGSGALADAPASEGRGSASSRGETRTLLDVRRLSVDYGSGSAAAHAVDEVSLTLGRGEILGLAGESGSGKSTLAHAIARLLRPPARVMHGEVLYYPACAPATPGASASAVVPGGRSTAGRCARALTVRAARISLAPAGHRVSERDERAEPRARHRRADHRRLGGARSTDEPSRPAGASG